MADRRSLAEAIHGWESCYRVRATAVAALVCRPGDGPLRDGGLSVGGVRCVPVSVCWLADELPEIGQTMSAKENQRGKDSDLQNDERREEGDDGGTDVQEKVNGCALGGRRWVNSGSEC